MVETKTKRKKKNSFVKDDVNQEATIKTDTVTIEHMDPVLDKVETSFEKQVVHKDNVHEHHIQPTIEVREKPIERQIYHPEERITVKEEAIYSTQGEKGIDDALKNLGLGESISNQIKSQIMSSVERTRVDEANEDTIQVSVSERPSSSSTTVRSSMPIETNSEVRIEREIIVRRVTREVHVQPVIYIHEPRIVEEKVFREVETVPTRSIVEDSSITIGHSPRIVEQPRSISFVDRLRDAFFAKRDSHQRIIPHRAPIRSQIGDIHILGPPPPRVEPKERITTRTTTYGTTSY